jgi:cell division protein FtsA
MRETFALRRGEMASAGSGMLPAGIILTGGAAQLDGMAELGREVLQMPVRIAAPSGIGGLVDTLLSPVYSTAVGLLAWGAAGLGGGEAIRYESSGPAGFGRIREALRSIFP